MYRSSNMIICEKGDVKMFHWASFLTYAVVTAVTPGPNNLMSMSNGGRRGFRGALPFNLGIWLGFSVVMLLCTLFFLGAYRTIIKPMDHPGLKEAELNNP